MKVLVVLALAVFTGCHANLLYADEPKPQIDVLIEAFWEKSSDAVESTVDMFRKSQIGPNIDAGLKEFSATMEELLHPTTKNLMMDLFVGAVDLASSLRHDLMTLSSRMQPQVLDVAARVEERVKQLKEKLTPYAESVDTETLNTLKQKSDELMAGLGQIFTGVQAHLGPYTELLLEVVEELLPPKDKVVPVVQNVQAKVFDRAQEVRDLIAPYAEDLGEKLNPYAQDLYDRVTSRYRSFITGN